MPITRAGVAAKFPIMAELILQTKGPNFLFFNENSKDWEYNLATTRPTARGVTIKS
jgi:hypothetical protein